MIVGIRALVGTISREELVSKLGCNVWVSLKKAMAGSHVEDVNEQDRGRDLGCLTQGRKDKSCDAISNFEKRITKLELGVVDTKGDVDLLEQRIEKAMGDLRGKIKNLQEGMQGSSIHTVSYKEFMAFEENVLCVLMRLESRVDTLTRNVEARDEQMRQELAICKIMVSA